MSRRLLVRLSLLVSAGLLGCAWFPGLISASASSSGTHYYGVTLSEIQVGPIGEASVLVAKAEVKAARYAWHANTVRLQIAQDKLTFADGKCPIARGGCLVYYQEIKQVVNCALRLGLTVVINDTTDASPFFTDNEPMPTYATEVLWKDIAGAYRDNPQVIFDLFNEPRGLGGTGAAQWRTWRDGGSVHGVSGYLGMQTVLSYVRNTLRASNTIWADGLDAAETLNGIEPHNAQGTLDGAPGSVGNYSLSQSGDAVSGPLVYTFHHPMGDQDRTAWWRDFGYLALAGVPVMDGEWNNSVDGTQYCWPDAPTSIPEYLSYLTGKNVGLTAWEIGPNVNPAAAIGGPATWAQSRPFDYFDQSLAESPASYKRPTTMAGRPALGWNCNNWNHAGSGQLLKEWFALQTR